MTSPEKIEALLKVFGETMEDLPKPSDDNFYVYNGRQLGNASQMAAQWHSRRFIGSIFNCEDYVCHQCDVIEKLVAALEKAVKLYNTTAIMINGITAQDLDEFIGLATNLQLT